jgi:hypothetical protein
MRIGFSSPASFRSTLHYHERKVRSGKAVLIVVGNFLKEDAELTIADKIGWFERLHGLNSRVHFPTLHVFISFSGRHDLSSGQMGRIATDYMDLIGFGEQPFLVYRHLDTGLPHMHIVSTTIRFEGGTIRTHNLAAGKSLAAKDLLTEKYKLYKPPVQPPIGRGPLRRRQYGDVEVGEYIGEVIGYVLGEYSFSSLTELNAVLTMYNVQADPGLAGGRIHTYKGLTYHMVDETGVRMGMPVPAAVLPSKPTLAALEQLAISKNGAYLQLKDSLEVRVRPLPDDWPDTWPAVVRRLNQQKIRLLPLVNKEGALYDAVFIDVDKHVAIALSRLSATSQNTVEDFRDCRTIAADIVRGAEILNKIPIPEWEVRQKQRNLRK